MKIAVLPNTTARLVYIEIEGIGRICEEHNPFIVGKKVIFLPIGSLISKAEL